MKAIINNTEYTIERADYGQYEISNGVQKFHSTDSRMMDAVMDEDDCRHNEMCKRLENLFFEEK